LVVPKNEFERFLSQLFGAISPFLARMSRFTVMALNQ